MVNTCAPKSAPTHQIRILWGVGRWAGCVLVSISERARSRTLEKFSRRDRDRDCAKFESSRRFRGSNMNPKKKLRHCRASVSIQALDLAISRFIHSLGSSTLDSLHTGVCAWSHRVRVRLSGPIVKAGNLNHFWGFPQAILFWSESVPKHLYAFVINKIVL